ncbi:MAG: hypothetical protein WC294_08315, partial [Methanoregula sp.]
MTPPLLPTDIKSINRAVDNYLIADNVKQTDIKLQQLERATAQRIAPILKRQGTITLREFERLEGIFQEETRQDNLNHAFSLAQLDTRDDFIKALTGPMSIASSLGGQTLSAQLGIKLSFNPVDPATHAYLQERAAESVTGIDDTTRKRLNTIIEKDYGEGKTYQQIARDLKNDFAEYSLPGGGERAKLIAVTELGNAHEGTKENMVRQIAQAGFKMKKFALTLKDEKVCNICRANMADGWIPIDQPHSSGHQRSKFHPGCRCPELYRADLPDVAGPQGDFAVKVSAFESDRSAEIITLEEAAEIEYAQLDSPQFTGEPTAPTPPEEDESERIATTEFIKRIVAALELQKGDKGDPGKDGKDGYTPIKGKDYFDGDPGYTPIKGKDYFDGKDSIVPGPRGEDSTVPGPKGDPGYTPIKGIDYQDGKDGESIKGDPGEPGPGLPPGGEPGQVPVKKSREDYDTTWEYPAGGVMWTGGNSGTGSGGDVVGPAGATDSNFASFDTATGKLIKDSGSKAADFANAVHTHATLPTSDEKAALVGTSGTAPSAANPLVDDADTRLTDNRTDAAAIHSVTDSASIDLTLTGDTLSADVLPAGLDTYVQFNDSGELGGDEHLTFDKATDTLHATYFTGDGSGLTGVGATVETNLTIAVKAKVQIRKGQAVFITPGVAAMPDVDLCDNTDATKSRILGIAVADITATEVGAVRRGGVLTNIDTRRTSAGGTGYVNTDEVWTEGNLLFVSTTGHLTNVRPTSGRIVKVGYTVKGNSNTDSIVVFPMENPVWVCGASGEDVVLRAGDAAGTNKVSIRDYANAEVGYVDSDGNADFDGDVNVATGKEYKINGTAHSHDLPTSPNPSAFSWTYDATSINTGESPGVNNIRFNNATPSSATVLTLSTTCNIGGISTTTITNWLKGISNNFGSGTVDMG